MRYAKPWMNRIAGTNIIQLKCGNCNAELMITEPSFEIIRWSEPNYDRYALELIGESDESQYHNYCGRCGTAVDWVRWEGKMTAEDWVYRMSKGRRLIVSQYFYDNGKGGNWYYTIEETIEHLKESFDEWDVMRVVPMIMEDEETLETKVTSVNIIGTTLNDDEYIVTLQGEVRIIAEVNTKGKTNQELFEQAMPVDERLLEEWNCTSC